jgi:hypothetical protein
VLNQVIDTVLARDKEFVKWRESHQGSYVPGAKERSRRTKASARRTHTDTAASGQSAHSVSATP